VVPRHVVMPTLEICAVWIERPFAREEYDGVIGDSRAWLRALHEAGCESRGEIASRPVGERAALRGARIDLEQMHMASVVTDEIQSVQPGQTEMPRDQPRGFRNFRAVHPTNDARRSNLAIRLQHVVVDRAHDFAIPG